MKRILLASALCLLTYTTTVAQRYEYPGQRYPDNATEHKRNDRRDHEKYSIRDQQREARRRIAIGIENGVLPTGEAIQLLTEYERIEKREMRFRANRSLSKRESRQLSNDLENLLRRIRSENRDGHRAGIDPARGGPRRGW
jgi:sulfite reductase beta subunit-like hemoprotein